MSAKIVITKVRDNCFRFNFQNRISESDSVMLYTQTVSDRDMLMILFLNNPKRNKRHYSVSNLFPASIYDTFTLNGDIGNKLNLSLEGSRHLEELIRGSVQSQISFFHKVFLAIINHTNESIERDLKWNKENPEYSHVNTISLEDSYRRLATLNRLLSVLF